MLRAWFQPLSSSLTRLLTLSAVLSVFALPGAIAAQPLATVVTSSAAQPASKTVTVKTKDDLSLTAHYWAPRSKKSSKKSALAPAALLLHDAGQSCEDLDAIAERMWKQGFAVMTLDLRGHGKSVADKFDWKNAEAEVRDTLWAFSTRDVEAAAAWLLKQKGVHRTNLNIIAHGAGCALAARHALEDENVRSIALLEPPTACHGFDLAADLLELGGLPTLILAPKKKASPTEKMVQEANATSAEHPYVTLMNVKSKTKVLDDKKTPSKIASWVKSQAAPSSK